MNFPNRKSLIAQIQKHLLLEPDGIDGQATWFAIGDKILGENHPSMRGMNPMPSRYIFIGRMGLIKAIQMKLKISVDGEDGSETWSALSEFFFPSTQIAPSEGIQSGSYAETVRGRSPNRNAGKNECKGIVFHHACGYFEGTIEWCLKPDTHAAYHCLVAQDGSRAILAKDEDRAHHAGKSSWRGRQSCNNFMLGIAFTGDTNTGAMRSGRDLNKHEIASAMEWVRQKQAIHRIQKSEITHHRVVSPNRKDDLSLNAWNQLQLAI